MKNPVFIKRASDGAILVEQEFLHEAILESIWYYQYRYLRDRGLDERLAVDFADKSVELYKKTDTQTLLDMFYEQFRGNLKEALTREQIRALDKQHNIRIGGQMLKKSKLATATKLKTSFVPDYTPSDYSEDVTTDPSELWGLVYDDLISQGFSPEEAVEKADEIVAETVASGSSRKLRRLQNVASRKATSLGDDYYIPIKLSASDNELLASMIMGQSDPLYALVSRTFDGPTLASDEEIETAISALEDLLDDPDTSPADEDKALGLLELLRRHNNEAGEELKSTRLDQEFETYATRKKRTKKSKTPKFLKTSSGKILIREDIYNRLIK